MDPPSIYAECLTVCTISPDLSIFLHTKSCILVSFLISEEKYLFPCWTDVHYLTLDLVSDQHHTWTEIKKTRKYLINEDTYAHALPEVHGWRSKQAYYQTGYSWTSWHGHIEAFNKISDSTQTPPSVPTMWSCGCA